MTNGITHLYHVSGLTDLAAQKKQAEKHSAQGGTSWVHEHHRHEDCNDNCKLYEPNKEN